MNPQTIAQTFARWAQALPAESSKKKPFWHSINRSLNPDSSVQPSMKRPHRNLVQVPDLDTVPMSSALRPLASRGEPRLHAKGRLLIQEGDTGGSLYIILSGRLRAFSASDDGSRQITYGEYFPGEFLGEMSLDGGQRSASVEAVEASWCVMVTRVTLEHHLSTHPEFAFELLSKVIRRARAATLSLRALALNDVYGRVAWLLNERALSLPDGSRAVGPITHQRIADLLGCTRPMVSKVLKELELGGYITTENQTIRIHRSLPARF